MYVTVQELQTYYWMCPKHNRLPCDNWHLHRLPSKHTFKRELMPLSFPRKGYDFKIPFLSRARFTVRTYRECYLCHTPKYREEDRATKLQSSSPSFFPLRSWCWSVGIRVWLMPFTCIHLMVPTTPFLTQYEHIFSAIFSPEVANPISWELSILPRSVC